MNSHSLPIHRIPPRHWAGILLCLLLGLAATPAPAGAAPRTETNAARPTAVARVAPPLAEEGWSLARIWTTISGGMRSQRSMVLLATIGMCIALYIMLRK